ncbi:alpha-ketoglutarate-dependent dioxygenase AlkB [Epidermidibacterium keratini]|uniref:Alpha-ketoglutarate-dependent dioxygenase AlkB n=1 Tax=Epidermidibacterium keratini TaxID=1891644 RepID=A0A7L4YMW8_9ACTN|nr:alpha-ketoglutarate-dependent dioxygenase AlkB [Epidermidibacterium keratini]QHC00184.1 alpha-ketoglutarate-dependent dioxygenase AlkB [Epidermidibacterium keratini]
MGLENGELFARAPVEIAPGAVHVPRWLSIERQSEIAAACREWARGPAPMRHTAMPRGGQMSVQTVCLGWHWMPYRYSRTADDVNGAPVAAVPDWLKDLGRDAVAAAYGDRTEYDADAVLINFYDATAKMGMHQDKEEVTDQPVVSLSIGDSCTFRFGNPQTRGKPYTDVLLESGDLFVFGGPSRFAYHGVPKISPGTAPAGCGIEGGRLNLTLRETGLS